MTVCSDSSWCKDHWKIFYTLRYADIQGDFSSSEGHRLAGREICKKYVCSQWVTEIGKQERGNIEHPTVKPVIMDIIALCVPVHLKHPKYIIKYIYRLCLGPAPISRNRVCLCMPFPIMKAMPLHRVIGGFQTGLQYAKQGVLLTPCFAYKQQGCVRTGRDVSWSQCTLYLCMRTCVCQCGLVKQCQSCLCVHLWCLGWSPAFVSAWILPLHNNDIHSYMGM